MEIVAHAEFTPFAGCIRRDGLHRRGPWEALTGEIPLEHIAGTTGSAMKGETARRVKANALGNPGLDWSVWRPSLSVERGQRRRHGRRHVIIGLIGRIGPIENSSGMTAMGLTRNPSGGVGNIAPKALDPGFRRGDGLELFTRTYTSKY